jgi:ribosome production factor 2
MRSYRVTLKKSGSRLPRVELDEMGPRMDLTLRRSHLSSDDLFNLSCKKVKNVDKPKKVKNITKDALGTTHGRVHVPAQSIGTIQTRKMKGLKETKEEKLAKKAEIIKEKKEKAEKARQANIEEVFAADDE